MIICHASDIHGHWTRPLPAADLYILTGDMLPNYILVVMECGMDHHREIWDPKSFTLPPVGFAVDRIVNAKREKERQDDWLKKQGGMRRYLTTTDAPVIIVRGNHDFTDMGKDFGGDVFEVNEDPTRTVTKLGLKIGGARGIPYIAGEWSDEMSNQQLEDTFGKLPKDLDILVTHAPPQGVLDSAGSHFGDKALRSYVDRHLYGADGYKGLKMHCFGHVHESRGNMKVEKTIFSNAATTYIVYDL